MTLEGGSKVGVPGNDLGLTPEALLNEAKSIPTFDRLLGYTILREPTSRQKIVVDQDRKTVTINPELYATEQLAEVAAATMVLRQSEIENILRTEKKETIKKIPPSALKNISDVALWTSAQRLKDSEKQALSAILSSLPLPDSYANEARNACFRYVATGTFPATSDPIRQLLQGLPVTSTGRNPIDALADGAVSLERKLDYYQKYITPILEQAQELDRQIEQTVGDSFKPSTENDDSETLDESEILQRVYPFFGGYYREKVFDGVDWTTMHVVATPQAAENEPGITVGDPVTIKHHTFQGSNGDQLAHGPISLPLPVNAEILKDSLTSGLMIKRDAKGIFFLTLDERVEAVGPPESYEFKLTLRSSPPDFMLAAPTEEEASSAPLDILFSLETQQRLTELAQVNISATAKAKRMVSLIHRTIEYVNSDEVGQLLGQAGTEYFKVLESVKKADCDVANFYLIAQLRSLGIPARMIRGFYVDDRRFGFAPLAGTMHAWTEYYDAGVSQWKRIDATPPKKEEAKEEDQDKEATGGGGGEEMREQVEDGVTNFEGDIESEGLTLDDTQLEQFTQFLGQKFDALSGQEDTAKQQADENFLAEHGITSEEWQRITAYIEQVNQTRIPQAETIDKLEDSTLGQEWEKFFDLFLVAYRLPNKTRRLQVRQSLGADLVDPSSATIDLLSGSDDPYGFELVKRGEQAIKLPIDFSNDFLLDLTASMEATDDFGQSLKEYQKAFVMSSLYHGFAINQQLKYYQGELSELPFISNHLVSVHGNNEYRELTSGEQEITMTQLSELCQLLSTTEQGAGNMVGGLQAYRDRLLAQPAMLQKIQLGEMVKTLTILSDGNLWCSSCGQESCRVYLHAESAAQSKKLVQELRGLGVIVNAIGFTETSRPVVSMFEDTTRPGSAVIASNVAQAVAMHHGQMIRSWETIQKAAEHRRLEQL